jgi:Carboxypeptidase regulatory-like domain
MLVCAAPIAAQQPPATSASAYAVLVGAVADSIHGGPLTGALVIVSGTDRQGVVDSTGRFRIDSIPPGDHQLGVFHPLLDSLNVSVSSKSVPMAAGVATSVFMATPSAMTVVGVYCSADERKSGPAAVIGRVLAPDGDDPIPNAVVRYSRTSMPSANDIARGAYRISSTFIKDSPATSAVGVFAICGLPLQGGTGTVHASRGQITTGELAADVSKWLIATVTLRLDTLRRGTAVVLGRLIDDNLRPIAHADIALANSHIKTTTSDSGTFALRDLPAGSQTIQIRKVGFTAIDTALMLSSKSPVQFELRVHQAAVTLSAVNVKAEREAALERVGFEHRRKIGIGRYLTADDMHNRGGEYFSDAMRTVLGLSVRTTRSGRQVIVPSRGASMGGRGCVAYVIDRAPFYDRPPGSIDDFLRPDDVIGVEVYQPSESPADVVTAPNCVSVVIWTKATSGGQ